MTSGGHRLMRPANSGIGFELARQLLAKTAPRWHVLLGCRSSEKGQKAAADLQAEGLHGTVEFLHLDVSDDVSVIRAAEDASALHGKVDVVVNNAGFCYSGERTRQSMHASFDTNVVGPMRVVEAFAPLLQKSDSRYGPRIVNVSSRAGSISHRSNKDSVVYNSAVTEYRTSKAALNMLSACQGWEYGKLGIKTFVYCPGFTVSNLTDFATADRGAQPVSEGARPIVDIIEGKRDDEVGSFLIDGGVTDW